MVEAQKVEKLRGNIEQFRIEKTPLKQQDEAQKNKQKSNELCGYHFALTGTFSEPRHDMIKLIEEHGGIVLHNVAPGTKFLIGSEDAFRRNSKKIQNAIDFKVPIVSEDFLREVLSKGDINQVDHHFWIISKEDFDDKHLGEIPKHKTRKPDPEYESLSRVEKDDMDNYWDIKLINKNENREVRMQILHDHSSYNLFIKYGHIGGGGTQKFTHTFKNKDDAIKEFSDRFLRKTRNNWDDYLDGKFVPLEGEYLLHDDYLL